MVDTKIRGMEGGELSTPSGNEAFWLQAVDGLTDNWMTTNGIRDYAIKIPDPVVLTSTAASIAFNLDAGLIFTHTLTENTTLANPTGGEIGQYYRLDTTMGATPFTMALGSEFRFAGGAWPGLTATALAEDRVFILKTGASSYDVVLQANLGNV